MSGPSGVIAPAEGDIYYYETMAELDAHEVAGDRRRARFAMFGARMLGYSLIVLMVGLVFFFRSAPVLQFLSVVGAGLLFIGWCLYDLLELCDD